MLEPAVVAWLSRLNARPSERFGEFIYLCIYIYTYAIGL